MQFADYLENRKFEPQTIKGHVDTLALVYKWCGSNGIDINTMTYNDIMSFIAFCFEKGLSVGYTNRNIGTIRYYFNYLKQIGATMENPAFGLSIKGEVKKVPANLLDRAEMDQLYRDYCIQLNVRTSKKVMLGLMIYQGLTLQNITKLKLHQIKTGEGKMFISATKNSNERILAIHPTFMPLLYGYLGSDNPKDRFFLKSGPTSKEYPKTIKWTFKHLFVQLKMLNPRSTNFQNLRMSVITEWLKKDNLRQVQYMTGHKLISSIERYQSNNIVDLQNELMDFHPMR